MLFERRSTKRMRTYMITKAMYGLAHRPSMSVPFLSGTEAAWEEFHRQMAEFDAGLEAALTRAVGDWRPS